MIRFNQVKTEESTFFIDILSKDKIPVAKASFLTPHFVLRNLWTAPEPF
jgi:hypothetical protein